MERRSSAALGFSQRSECKIAPGGRNSSDVRGFQPPTGTRNQGSQTITQQLDRPELVLRVLGVVFLFHIYAKAVLWVERTAHAAAAAIQHMSVNHSGLDILVSQ